MRRATSEKSSPSLLPTSCEAHVSLQPAHSFDWVSPGQQSTVSWRKGAYSFTRQPCWDLRSCSLKAEAKQSGTGAEVKPMETQGCWDTPLSELNLSPEGWKRTGISKDPVPVKLHPERGDPTREQLHQCLSPFLNQSQIPEHPGNRLPSRSHQKAGSRLLRATIFIIAKN